MLDQIRIASPCSASWEEMQGDDRIRHCQACNQNVYNLSAFTEHEIRELVANRQGRLCGRIYQRRDGTVMAQNCPVGLRAVTRRISRIAGAILSFLIPSFVAAPAFAQSYSLTNVKTPGVSLEITDPAGAGIAQATATLRDPMRNLEIKGTADKQGRLFMRAPLGGQYLLQVSAPYMQSSTEHIELRQGQNLSMPVVLSVAIMGEIVEIEPSSQSDQYTVTPSPNAQGTSSSPKPMQR
ncbi:MAG TPA: carboxypeptidase-like regulatory domain-containing protein [Candidatus Angelobacter sp.]|jgi:hypothetical protein|nr:carboxypeptidase-like regulatory domain-containing protein [Candidatus Angelobacter sp.]